MMSEESSASSSSESSSDTDEEVIQDMPDEEFIKTLSCLKKRDPIIYDSSVNFFTEPPLIIKKSESSPSVSKLTNVDNSENLKLTLRDSNEDSSSEDELLILKNGSKLKANKEEEKKLSKKDEKAESDLKPLNDLWDSHELNEDEKFLREYILNKKYLSAEIDAKAEEDLSEDEREIEKQAEYEANYNFRFENEENLKIKRYPRTIEGSLRRKNDSRSKKRAEVAQRKKEEKLKKQQEIKKKQKEKLSEIQERLQKLKELTGNVELGFKDEEILEDFDPDKHDQKMKELFNDDYYNEEDKEYPVFDDEESYWNNENINMDCDADTIETNESKLTRTQKKKLRKKKTYKDVLDLAKPSFDPKIHSDFKKYIDEYYSLDCEDFIDDMPCKFKYREVVPNDYGLSIEEILMADDKELNRWASVKKITRRQPEHVEKNEVKIYKKKAQDDYLKKKLIPSLYAEPQVEQSENSKPSDIEENDDEKTVKESVNNQLNEDNGENSIKRKRKKKKKNCNIERSSENNELLESKENKIIKLDNGIKVDEEEDTLNNTNCEINKANEIHNNENSNISKKKRRKRKKKKSNNNESTPTVIQDKSGLEKSETSFRGENSVKKFNNQRNKSNKTEKDQVKNKLKKKIRFKNRKEDVVNLSDDRLKAYGIKPKQFRSKILYSQKSETK